jgi:hypothetical protein
MRRCSQQGQCNQKETVESSTEKHGLEFVPSNLRRRGVANRTSKDSDGLCEAGVCLDEWPHRGPARATTIGANLIHISLRYGALLRPHDILFGHLLTLTSEIQGAGNPLAMSLLRFVNGYAQLFVFLRLPSRRTVYPYH